MLGEAVSQYQLKQHEASLVGSPNEASVDYTNLKYDAPLLQRLPKFSLREFKKLGVLFSYPNLTPIHPLLCLFHTPIHTLCRPIWVILF